MVQLGIAKDNYAAIRAATAVGSTVIHLQDQIGTLQAGKLADVIVVAGNPLEDLDALKQVHVAFVGGRRLV